MYVKLQNYIVIHISQFIRSLCCISSCMFWLVYRTLSDYTTGHPHHCCSTRHWVQFINTKINIKTSILSVLQ